MFFKKSRPILKDLIPEDYTDIHSHLLPGIDDGAKTPAHAVSLISGLTEIGVRQFVTTPHIINSVWDNNRENIEATHAATMATLEKEGMNVPLRAAAEYMMDSFFFDLLKKGEPLLTLKDNYVLVEMSYLSAPIQLYDFIFELQLEGYKPVLAHPERYLFYYNKFEEYNRLKKAGCLFQLNLLSTVGYYGGQVAHLAQRLIDREMYDFVGSDLHHENHLNAFGNKIVLKNHGNMLAAIDNNKLFAF